MVGGAAAATPGLASLMVFTVEGGASADSGGTMMAPVGLFKRMVFGPAPGVGWAAGAIGAVARLAPGASMPSRMMRDVARLPGSVGPISITRVVLFLEVDGRAPATTVSALAISEGMVTPPVFCFFWGAPWGMVAAAVCGWLEMPSSTMRAVAFLAASSSVLADAGDIGAAGGVGGLARRMVRGVPSG